MPSIGTAVEKAEKRGHMQCVEQAEGAAGSSEAGELRSARVTLWTPTTRPRGDVTQTAGRFMWL